MDNKPTDKQSTVDKEAIDMTAQEWFEKGSMFTLDFLLPAERETIYKIMDLYAHGKVRYATQLISGSKDKEIAAAELCIMSMLENMNLGNHKEAYHKGIEWQQLKNQIE